MKKILLVVILFLSFNGIAQNLENKIPKSAKAVVVANGDRIFELLPMSVLDNSDLVRKILKAKKINTLKDLGIDFEQKAYYFYQVLDKKQYHNFMIKLSDKSKFEAQLSPYQKKKITTVNGNSFLFNSEFTTAWNDELLVISIRVKPRSNYSNRYIFDRSEVTEVVADEAIDEVEIEEVEIEEVAEPVQEVEETIVESIQPEEVVEVEEVESEEKIIARKKRREAASAKRAAERAKIQLENSKYVMALLRGTASNSITNNSSYTSGKENKSSAYVWVANYGEIIDDITKLTQSPYSIYSRMNMSYKKMVGIKDVKANLFFDKDEVRVSSVFNLTDEKAAQAKKMYNTKLSRKFYQYFDQKNVLAYLSSSINMEETLKIYPEMIKQIYGSVLPKYNEEIDVASDLISILLDEEAIGKLITGDALFVLNGIEKQEISYTTYKYDENYKRSKVTKTKDETLPVFTVMLGSENKKFVDKLLRLSAKHKFADVSNNIFTLNKKMTKSPIDLYFTIQDDIVFLTNSKGQMHKIVAKSIDSDLGKHKRFFKKNMATFYVNSEKIIAQLPKNELGMKIGELTGLVEDNIKETYITFSKVKGTKMYSEYVTKTADTSENSLRLIFSLIESLAAKR